MNYGIRHGSRNILWETQNKKKFLLNRLEVAWNTADRLAKLVQLLEKHQMPDEKKKNLKDKITLF